MDGYWKSYFELNGVSIYDATQLCKRLSDKAEKAVWYLHPVKDRTGKELPHIHGLIYNFSKTDDTFRNEVKKTLNVKGAQLGVSNTYERGTKMTEEHISKYVCYMSKGKFDPIYVKGFEQPWLNETRSQWREPQTVRISGDLTVITNGDVKKKTITQFAIARELEIWILEQVANDNHPTHANIIRQARTILHSHNRLADDNMIVKIVQDAMWPTHETSRIQKIISRL